MIGEPLLDTNIVIDLFAARAEVVQGIREASRVFVSSVVIGELCFGAEKSAHVTKNLARIEAFIPLVSVLAVDVETARLYGAVRRKLRRIGSPIPENDIWIASVALQHGLTLITRDQHFEAVEGLQTVVW
jgi:tRNA(fMet)-specific endonuclease VapC